MSSTDFHGLEVPPTRDCLKTLHAVGKFYCVTHQGPTGFWPCDVAAAAEIRRLQGFRAASLPLFLWFHHAVVKRWTSTPALVAVPAKLLTALWTPMREMVFPPETPPEIGPITDQWGNEVRVKAAVGLDAQDADNVELLAREMFARDWQFNNATDVTVPGLDRIRYAWELDGAVRHYYRQTARRALNCIDDIVHGEGIWPAEEPISEATRAR